MEASLFLSKWRKTRANLFGKWLSFGHRVRSLMLNHFQHTIHSSNERRELPTIPSHPMTKEIIVSRCVVSAFILLQYTIFDSMESNSQRIERAKQTEANRNALAPFNYRQLKLKIKYETTDERERQREKKLRLQAKFIE